MNKRRSDSTIEVWNEKYINHPSIRSEEDVNAEIVQIEIGHDDVYMVEVVRPDE